MVVLSAQTDHIVFGRGRWPLFFLHVFKACLKHPQSLRLGANETFFRLRDGARDCPTPLRGGLR